MVSKEKLKKDSLNKRCSSLKVTMNKYKVMVILLVLLYVISFAIPLSLHMRYLDAQNMGSPQITYSDTTIRSNTHPIDKPDQSTLTLRIQAAVSSLNNEDGSAYIRPDQHVTLLNIEVEIGDFLPYHEVITNPNYVDMGRLEAFILTAWTFIMDEQNSVLILMARIKFDNTSNALTKEITTVFRAPDPQQIPFWDPTPETRFELLGHFINRTYIYDNRTLSSFQTFGTNVGQVASPERGILVENGSKLPSYQGGEINDFIVVWPNITGVIFNYVLYISIGIISVLVIIFMRKSKK